MCVCVCARLCICVCVCVCACVCKSGHEIYNYTEINTVQVAIYTTNLNNII